MISVFSISILFIALIFVYIYWRFFFFFRDPEREIPSGENIVSAADGTVVYIRRIEKGEIPISIKKGKKIFLKEFLSLREELFNLEQPLYIVGIFMHPTSVHVNRAPIGGRIIFNKYLNNRKNLPMTLMWFRTLLRVRPYEKFSKHILENEKNIILIKGKIPLAVIQIADIYVNKIVSFVKEGEEVNKGQRIGAIKMGSQVDMIFPCNDDIKIKIKEGQKIKAGSTIVAEC